MNAVAAIRAVAFLRPRVHIAGLFAQITVIAGLCFKDAKQAETAYRFKHSARGAGKAAPGNRQSYAQDEHAQNKHCAKNPYRLGEIPGLDDGREEFPHANGNVHARLIHLKKNPQGQSQPQVFAPRHEFFGHPPALQTNH